MLHQAPKPPLEQMRYLHLLPLLLVTMLLVSSLPLSEQQPDEPYFRYSNCTRTPYECGSLKFDVDYPFSTTGGVADAARSDYCSCPGYRLVCANGTLMISMRSGAFQVTNVDYGNQILTVVDQGLTQGRTCPATYRNTTIDDALFEYTRSDQFLTAYVNCSGRLSSLSSHIDASSCPSYRGGISFNGGARIDNASAPDFIGVCSTTLVIPYNSRMAGSLAAGNSTLEDAIRGGFTVRWKAGMGWCSECQASGGRCGYNSVSPSDHTCYCPNGQTIGLCSSGSGHVGTGWCSECQASGGRCGYNSGSPSDHTCYCPDGQTIGLCSSGSGHVKKTRKKIYIIASTSSTLVLCLLFLSIFLGYKIHRSRKKSKETPGIESFLQKNRNIHPKRYTYAQVKRMTKTFAEKLGQGGFGVVYRGGLSDGRQVAVKMLKDSKADVEEFINEVSSISRTSHVNVVTLLGFCLEGSKRALIYDYMSNGSLEKYAFKGNSKGENTLSWQKLFDIVVGIARGLEYLHRGCNTRIVHFDIKPHNILLDQDFCPKISDFGLAKLCPNKESVISIGGARGTIGYIAPEVFSKQFGTVSSKSDVYSYGMMVLEMVGARDKNIHANSESSSQYFPEWIYQHLDEYCASASDLNGEVTEIVQKMVVVGLWCIQLGATNRPTMTRVVEMLEGSTSGLELPPQELLSR